MGEEGQVDGDARQIGAEIFGPARAGTRAGPGPCAARPGAAPSRAIAGNDIVASAASVQAIGRPGSSDQPGDEQRDERRRHEAAAQVVEDLPARDERQAIALEAGAGRHPREQPPQDLPVAAHPAVLPARVGQHVRRVVVDDLDVGDERGPRVNALEQIVREQRVLGHAAFERRHERVDVVEALAGEDALAEQILVDVRHRGRVRIDAGVAGIGAREQRSGGAGHRHADARLQDAVAVGDAPQLRIDDRPVERMRDDADQLARGIARQLRVGVERDAVPARRPARRAGRPAS